jgi:RNA-directed DNA polymerase
MQDISEREIEQEARKRLRRFRREGRLSDIYRIKFEKRTGAKGKATAKAEPKYWSLNKHFNPAYCIKHRAFLAKGIWRAIEKDKFRPTPSIEVRIKKPSGGERKLHVFSIPDAAVSNLFTRNILRRHDGIFSSSSFAYRPNKTPLDAIIHLRNLTDSGKVFVVSIDFKSYFDSIPTDYLHKIIFERRSRFLTTHAERHVINGFLRHRFAGVVAYSAGLFESRKIGVPQGTSISLFLANAAAHALDIQLEKMNGRFVRYADDVVMIANSYEDAIRAHNTFKDFSERTGIPINEEKSHGIRLLGIGEKPEIKATKSIDFLGYSISNSKILLSDKSIARFKGTVGKIIYNHLILYPKKFGTFNSSRIGLGFIDWDLVTCINDIRRYLYGGISESSIRGYLDAKSAIRRFKSISAYYCLCDDVQQFASLDGWLVNILQRAHEHRRKLLAAKYGIACPRINKSELISGDWYRYAAVPFEAQCPSFVVSWRTARKKWLRKGLVGLSLPDNFYSYE